ATAQEDLYSMTYSACSSPIYESIDSILQMDRASRHNLQREVTAPHRCTRRRKKKPPPKPPDCSRHASKSPVSKESKIAELNNSESSSSSDYEDCCTPNSCKTHV
ncbi:unnamed protein product, partial [Meganyctiphanes norvegica]